MRRPTRFRLRRQSRSRHPHSPTASAVSDTNVVISGSVSASQSSAADGSTISVNESAAADADLSLCPEPSPLCTAVNEGMTQVQAEFCIASDTTYSLTGSVQASASEDVGTITATGVVSIENAGSSMFIYDEQ